MPNYDWTEFDGRPLTERFPEWAKGLEELRGANDVFDALRRIAESRRTRTEPPRRVFVSHRQADVALAKQIASEISRQGFEYWLDVFDPNLGAAAALPPPAQAYAVAVIIEMALLNCTHVVAVMTKKTAGSQWVPYEYGRVKEPTPVSIQAAAWIDPHDPPSSKPEYLLLGPQLFGKPDLIVWLQTL